MSGDKKGITPGKPIATHIVAKAGGAGEKILRQLAQESSGDGSRYPFSFGPWQRVGDWEESLGTITVGGEVRGMTLRIGDHADIERAYVLTEGTIQSHRCMIARRTSATIAIGLRRHQRSVALQLLMGVFVYGDGWVDSTGKKLAPFGKASTGKKRNKKNSHASEVKGDWGLPYNVGSV